jgi:hypothetical protein
MKPKQAIRDIINRKIRENNSLIKYSKKEKIKELVDKNKDLQEQLNELKSQKKY